MKDKSNRIIRERRKSPRYHFDGSLKIGSGENVVNSPVCNIGREGIFIKMSSPVLLGTAFTAQLNLKEPVLINCVVRRVEAGLGMGLSLVAPGAEGRRRFTAFLNTLARE